MKAQRYPANDQSHLVERVEDAPPGSRLRRWVLRDDNRQHYHGIVRLTDTPAYIELFWKATESDAEQAVGLFCLHLPELLAVDYIRFEKEEEKGDAVRVRFYRGSGGVVYLQTRSDRPALPVGMVDLAR